MKRVLTGCLGERCHWFIARARYFKNNQVSGNDSVWCGDRYDDVFPEVETQNAKET